MQLISPAYFFSVAAPGNKLRQFTFPIAAYWITDATLLVMKYMDNPEANVHAR
jgi:hypothetical protein